MDLSIVDCSGELSQAFFAELNSAKSLLKQALKQRRSLCLRAL